MAIGDFTDCSLLPRESGARDQSFWALRVCIAGESIVDCAGFDTVSSFAAELLRLVAHKEPNDILVAAVVPLSLKSFGQDVLLSLKCMSQGALPSLRFMVRVLVLY